MTARLRSPGRILALAAALASAPAALRSQEQPAGSSSFSLGPSVTGWLFKTAIPSDSLLIKGVAQVAFPVAFTMQTLRGRLTIDAGAAYAIGRVYLDGGRHFELSGLTDARIRAVARVIGDRLLLTLGFNAPIGKTRLTGHQVDALGILGAPALGFSTPVLGNGPGGTGGLVYALRAGSWGVAFGSSLEVRGQYTPLEAQIAGVQSPADLRPGKTVRFSLGADRLIGRGRFSLLLAGDVYGTSRIQIASGANPVARQYKLGPQLSGTALMDFGLSGFRTFSLAVSDRYRSQYTGSDGNKAAGSSGNVLEGSFGFITGRDQAVGLSLRFDGRLDSGLEVDNTITTAAMTSGGVTLGVFVPVGYGAVHPFVRGQLGKLDTGPNSTTAIGAAAGISWTLRP